MTALMLKYFAIALLFWLSNSSIFIPGTSFFVDTACNFIHTYTHTFYSLTNSIGCISFMCSDCGPLVLSLHYMCFCNFLHLRRHNLNHSFTWNFSYMNDIWRRMTDNSRCIFPMSTNKALNSTYTFANCGHLKEILLPDLQFWEHIGIDSLNVLNAMWRFYEIKIGRFLFISLLVKGAFYM